DGFRSRAREEHAVELRLRDLAQEARELDRRRMRALEKVVVVREDAELPRRGLDELFAAVAHVHAPEAGHAVQDAVAVDVVDVDAVRTRDDATLFPGQLL